MSLIVGGVLVYGLYFYVLEIGGVVVNLNRAYDFILDLFNFKDGSKSLGGGVNVMVNVMNEGNVMVEIEVNVIVVDDVNVMNVMNVIVISSLDEILAEVGDVEDDEEE